jgi:hypothetical protein
MTRITRHISSLFYTNDTWWCIEYLFFWNSDHFGTSWCKMIYMFIYFLHFINSSRIMDAYNFLNDHPLTEYKISCRTDITLKYLD